MSSFIAKVKNKQTGEIKECFFIDDYYGRHNYGYRIGAETLTEGQFVKNWERHHEHKGEEQ